MPRIYCQCVGNDRCKLDQDYRLLSDVIHSQLRFLVLPGILSSE